MPAGYVLIKYVYFFISYYFRTRLSNCIFMFIIFKVLIFFYSQVFLFFFSLKRYFIGFFENAFKALSILFEHCQICKNSHCKNGNFDPELFRSTKTPPKRLLKPQQMMHEWIAQPS